MEGADIEWVTRAIDFWTSFVGLSWGALVTIWKWLVDLQAKYPQLLSMQTLFGLFGSIFGVWKWWERREANLFRRFEEMIEREEALLVKACTDILDVMNRPGPGVRVQAPLFVEKPLRLVLARRRWDPASLWPVPQTVDRRLTLAIGACDRKVTAHLARLSLFRKQIASARLLQGALATARVPRIREEHVRQSLDQEALDRFRAVLALPGHKEDLTALELTAHQLARMDRQSQSAATSYEAIIRILKEHPESPSRNLLLGRAKRCLAVLRYPTAPGVAQGLLTDAINLLTQFGPPRDRDLLELAETVHLDGIARLRLNQTIQGPQQLSLAQGHYRDLQRHLRSRRRSLFRWMFRDRSFAGHRVVELLARTERGLARIDHLIDLASKPRTLIRGLMRRNGVPRHNRRPPS